MLKSPYRVWRSQALAPAPLGDPSEQGVITLDRDTQGVQDGSVSRADNAPKLRVLLSQDAELAVPALSGAVPLVFPGIGFAELQKYVPPAKQEWKVAPGQLAEPGRVVFAPTASLALMREVEWDRAEAKHHLLHLPAAQRIERGARATVKAPSLLLVGAGAVEVVSDITNASLLVEDGQSAGRRARCEAYSVTLPTTPYHHRLAPILDAQGNAQPSVTGLSIPRHSRELSSEELVVPFAENLREDARTSGFFPVLEDQRHARLAFAYTRADGTVGVLLSDTEMHVWLKELSKTLAIRFGRILRPSEYEMAPTDAHRAVFADIKTRSPVFAQVLEQARLLAPGEDDLLLLGETGTGKEHLARALHAASPRSAGPFIAVNCALETSELIESHLFGHVRGAFTGAVAPRKGKFLEADGGTLLLDEVGDSSLKFQLALLRALETRRITPVGGDKEIPVNVRVLSATSRDMPQLLAENKFREDLYYRLVGSVLTLPPLRERREDLAELAEALLARLPRPAVLHSSTLTVLRDYSWPGNVRELFKVLSAAGNKVAAQHAALSEDTFLKDTRPVTLLPEHISLQKDDAGWHPVPEPAYFFGVELKKVAAQIWSERALPPLNDLSTYRRRALLRAALLYLDTESPRDGWDPALQGAWKRLFGSVWATTEGGRSLREVVALIAVAGREKEARLWVEERVGKGDKNET